MDLRINQTYGKIGIDRNPGYLEIQSNSAVLELRQIQAKINVHTELPKVEIDQYECFASAGLKNDIDLARETSERTYQQVLDYIGKTAQDGKLLAAIESGGNPIAAIAKRDSTTVHEFGLVYLPKVAPKIDVKGSIDIRPEENPTNFNNGVKGDFIPAEININYTPTKLEIFIKQYPSIDIQFVGNNIDTSI